MGYGVSSGARKNSVGPWAQGCPKALGNDLPTERQWPSHGDVAKTPFSLGPAYSWTQANLARRVGLIEARVAESATQRLESCAC